jgi:hypothetical protein
MTNQIFRMFLNFISLCDIILTFRYFMLEKGKCKFKDTWYQDLKEALANSLLPAFVLSCHTVSNLLMLQN